MATFVSNLFYFFLASLLFVFITITSFELYYDKRGPSEHEQLLIINKGQSVAHIASQLRDKNIIENRTTFMLIVRLKGFHDKIKFGEYMIPETASIKEIIDILVEGVSFQNKITIPEGMSTISVVHLINNDERIRFIAGCHGLSALEKKVNENLDSVAFSIFPSEITDVIRVADNNLTMPPKSTWFDPKPLDGLVVYEFE